MLNIWPWSRIALLERMLTEEQEEGAGLNGRCNQLQIRVNALSADNERIDARVETLEISEANARTERDAWKRRAEAAEAELARRISGLKQYRQKPHSADASNAAPAPFTQATAAPTSAAALDPKLAVGG